MARSKVQVEEAVNPPQVDVKKGKGVAKKVEAVEPQVDVKKSAKKVDVAPPQLDVKKSKKTATKVAVGGSKTNKAPLKKEKTDYRYFKLIDAKSLESYGRYTGDTPKQAASKGYTKLVRNYKKEKKTLPKVLTIYLRESTRNHSGKVYGYDASRIKLKVPQTVTIIDNKTKAEKQIVYEYRNKIRKAVIPEQIGGLSKKNKALTSLKAKKAKSVGKKVKSGSKTAKPTKPKTVKAVKAVETETKPVKKAVKSKN